MEITANTPMKFPSSSNIRELGGYMGEDGTILNRHKLLRAGDLSELTDEELNQLKDYGIRVCIDLRIVREKRKADPFYLKDDLIYHSIPIGGEVFEDAKPKELLYRLYINILEQYQDALLREMRIIADEEAGIVFHCTAGKDRTGLTAMLILSVCGVCEEQIIADYETSEENNKEQIKMQREELEKIGLTDVPGEIFQSEPYTMRKTIEYLNENYGGPVPYLKAIGLKENEICAIREKMLGKEA